MKSHLLIAAMLSLVIGMALVAGFTAIPQQVRADDDPPAPAATSAANSKSSAVKQEDEDALRLEGEKRFHANCGRCHQAPHKFPPRMMATIVRHMRVRATITDEDMRVILHYMTQ